MFFTNVFHAKVIDNQRKLYGSCVVLPKARNQFALSVSVFVKTFFEEFVGQYSCLWEAVHAVLSSDVNVAIFGVFFSEELVFVDDLIGDII